MRTGLQRRVIALYRTFLREARKLEGPQRKRFEEQVRTQFKKDAISMPKVSVDRIEYALRMGHKKLALVQTPGFRGMGQ